MAKKYKAADLCRELGIQPYVLRYWETEFPSLRDEMIGSSTYTEDALTVARRIKGLLYDEGYTIVGAKKKLAAPEPEVVQTVLPTGNAESQDEQNDHPETPAEEPQSNDLEVADATETGESGLEQADQAAEESSQPPPEPSDDAQTTAESDETAEPAPDSVEDPDQRPEENTAGSDGSPNICEAGNEPPADDLNEPDPDGATDRAQASHGEAEDRSEAPQQEVSGASESPEPAPGGDDTETSETDGSAGAHRVEDRVCEATEEGDVSDSEVLDTIDHDQIERVARRAVALRDLAAQLLSDLRAQSGH